MEARRRVTEQCLQKERLKLEETSVSEQEGEGAPSREQMRPGGTAEEGAVRTPVTVAGRHREHRFGAMGLACGLSPCS